MKYINKNNEAHANPIMDDYLTIARAESYDADHLYKQFGSFSRKNELIDNVLLPEQDNLCCYCMRSLPNHTYATIEHIIRQSIPDNASMSRYFKLHLRGLDIHNICHTDDYLAGKSLPGQYPHKVAYHNFAMACPMCNNNRGDKDIYPLFLYPNIQQEISYNRQTGELTWLTDPELIKPLPALPTVEKVGINSSLLKAIRSVWFFGKDHPTATYSTPDTVSNEVEKQELVYLAFGEALSFDPSFTMEDMNTFLSLLTPHIWQNFVLKYSYFATL